jgi:mono/diheme cytochrome c family protein
MQFALSLGSALLWLALLAPAYADEQPVALKDGPGRPAVEANCAACHSLDYIRMNSPFLSPKGWEAEVSKMINAYGAPIAPEDAKAIADYLSRHYGVPG